MKFKQIINQYLLEIGLRLKQTLALFQKLEELPLTFTTQPL